MKTRSSTSFLQMDFERDDWFLCIAAIQIGVPQRRLHCLTNWNTPYARAAAAPRRGARARRAAMNLFRITVDAAGLQC